VPRLEVAPGMEGLLAAAGIHDARDALDPRLGAAVTAARSSWVRRVETAGRGAVYVKCFVYPTAKDVILRIVSRRLVWHRARREWRSMLLQEKLGLPVVNRVALGEIRLSGFLRAAVLVTEELAGARPLHRILRDGAGWPAEMPETAAAIADYAARLHTSGFVHGDLNARNVLVASSDGTVDVRNIDSARGRRLRWRGRLWTSHLRDLAPLALAFSVIRGKAAAAELTARYLSRVRVSPTPALGARIEAEVRRIEKKERSRLSE
jgi:tRNA A-37 threonylcarbamoyl transferase component Bud32